MSLDFFPNPPASGEVTSHEQEGRFHFAPPEEAIYCAQQLLGSQYVDISVGSDTVSSAHWKQEARDAFNKQKETLWHRVHTIYYEEGLKASLKELSESENSAHKLTATIALVITKFYQWVEFSCQLPMRLLGLGSPNDTDDIGLRQNMHCSILGLFWHPHSTRAAVVLRDDTVHIFAADTNGAIILKHRLQIDISDAAWMPYSSSQLAVACKSSIMLWTVDPTGGVSRPTASCVVHLSHPDASPFHSLSWHPKGTIIASGGNSGSLVVWDVGMAMSSVVHSGTGGKVTLVLWSPVGSRVFVGYTSKLLRVFETVNWTFESWNTASPVRSATWSSCGRFLLFSTEKETVVFSLEFTLGRQGEVGGTRVASRVIDAAELEVATAGDEEEHVLVGGVIHAICWDSTSERLAVSFKSCDLIAIFHTSTYPTLTVTPGAFIRGESGSPVHLSFQKNVSFGVVLSIVWSSGFVQHMPMFFVPRPRPITIARDRHNHVDYSASVLLSSTLINSPDQDGSAQVRDRRSFQINSSQLPYADLSFLSPIRPINSPMTSPRQMPGLFTSP